ncbi:MAG: hypothetical protein Q8R05_01160 [Candidatus Omnitrophota bacterium]|nr:hypothetical protein [Candidatus Omnitrophota bacterium]
MGIKDNLSLCKSVWSVTFKTLAKYPSLLIPFFMNAVFQGLVLTVLFYYPRSPFSAIFGQPVQAFYGIRFLHYPYNFLLLPKLFYYGQILATLTLGVVMFGMAMGMVSQIHTEGTAPRIGGSINRSLRRYLPLVGIWLVTFIISLIILRGPAFLIMKFMQPTTFAKILLQVVSYGGILAVFLVEALFIYAYPAIVVERAGFLKGIARSFSISKGVFLTTAILVIVPRILDVIGIIIKDKMTNATNINFPDFPEITVVMLAILIGITLITDSLVFLSTANLFMLKKETEK